MNFAEPEYIINWKPKFLRPRTYKSFHGLDEVVAEVLAEMSSFGRTKRQLRQKERAVVAIIASMHGCVVEGRPLGIKLDSGKYKFMSQLYPEWWTYRTIKAVVDMLQEAEFVKKRKGFYNPETGEGRITKLYARDRLLNLFKIYAPVAYETESHQTLVLRDNFKEDITYTVNAFTHQKQRFITRLNEWLGGFIVMLDDRILGTEYISIHSRSNWKKHGRFYNDLQNLPPSERDRITINGEPVEDIDYTSLHPRMCYAREGIPPVQVDGDYYLPILNHLGIYRCLSCYSLLRMAVKRMVSIMINARDELEACNAFRDKVSKAKSRIHTPKKAKLLEMEQAMEAHNIDLDDLISAIEEVHHPIEHYFNSDAGVDLMFEDSNIMQSILEQCMARNTPALTVHDSIIVQKKHAREAERIMEEQFTNYYEEAPHRIHNATP